MVLGLTTAGVGALGWLCGPVVGNAVFGLWYRKWGREIAAVSPVFSAAVSILCSWPHKLVLSGV